MVWFNKRKISKGQVEESHKWNEETAKAMANSAIIKRGANASILDRAYLGRDAYDTRRKYNGGYGELLPTTDKDIIKACNIIYQTIGIVRNAIDLMQEFASAGLEFRHADDDVKIFYKAWAEKVRLQQVIEWILLEYYKSGNVVIFRNKGKLSIVDEERMVKYVHADKADGARPKKDVRDREIPIQYTVLDPLLVEKTGTELFGDFSITVTFPSELAEIIKNPKTNEQKDAVEKLKPLLKKSGNSLCLELPQDRVYLIHRKKQPYEAWARPFLYSILDDVYYKNKLRMMDRAAADSIINSITLIKVGSDEYPAKPETIKQVAAMLTSEAKSMYFVWNHCISIQSDYAPVGEILGEEKYAAVNRDILTGLGISEVILGGQGTNNYSTSFLSVKTLLERLEDGRDKVIEWLNKEMKEVAIAMGFKEVPEVVFAHMSLKDEAKESQIILSAYDKNLISPHSAIDALRGRQLPGFEEEVGRMRELNKYQENGLFMKPSQIQQGGGLPLSLMGINPNGTPRTTMPTNKKIKKDKGRPGGNPINETIPERTVTPKGAAIIDYAEGLEECEALAEKYYNEIERTMTGKLSSDEIFNIFSHISVMKEMDDIISVANLLMDQDLHKITEKHVMEVFSRLLINWKERNKGISPGDIVLKKLRKNAWAIFRAWENFRRQNI